jgi:hypothetical protein
VVMLVLKVAKSSCLDLRALLCFLAGNLYSDPFR